MKKIYLTIALCAMAVSTASAQQLPNVGFEGDWNVSRPWNTVCDTLALINNNMMGNITFGMNPEGWQSSNVIGVVSEKDAEYGGGYGALGTTEVLTKVDGYNSASAIKLTNNPNPFMATQIVPAYLSLGTPWATNTLDFLTFSPANKDGGVFGGLAFDKRPDALAFDYQRAYGEAGEAQDATVLVYAWKGSWSQTEVPGNNSMSSQVVKATMVDRDRNILGMETAQGGAVTASDDALLIAKSLDYIKGEAAEWTSYTLPVKYLSDATPSKINVVIAANDYFDSEKIVNGNSLTVDNVRFVYYSRLAGLTYGGEELPGISPDVYAYEFEGEMPATDDLTPVLLGEGKSASIVSSVEGNTLTLTVSNENGEDVDGKNEHVYTFTWKGNAATTTEYSGKLTIEMNGGFLTPDGGQDATIEITPTGDNTCDFVLPNFSLDLGGGPTPLGDIVVNDVKTTTENGVTTYVGAVKGLKLLGGAIVADVDLNGTIDASGNVNMKIDVLWNDMPINVTFTKTATGVTNVAVDSNAPVEFYNLNGVRVSGDAPGLYIRRQGNTVSKVIVK